jgi:hypothetical protein
MDKKEKTNATTTRPCGERYLPLESSKDLSMGSGFVFVFPCFFLMWISSLFAAFWNWKLPFQRYLVFAIFWSSNLSFSIVYLPYFGV